MSMEPLIKINEISRTFSAPGGDLDVLKGVSFEVEAGERRFHHLTKGKGWLDEPPLGLRADKTQLHGLAAKAYRYGEMRRLHGLLADIQKSILDAGRQAGKNHALEPPVRKVNQFLVLGGIVGQQIPKVAAFNEIGTHFAERTLK